MSNASRGYRTRFVFPRNIRFAASASAVALSTALLFGAPGHSQNAIDLNQKATVLRDQNLELSMKIKKPFTVVTVGDMLQMVPFSTIDDPDIQYLVNIMRTADLTLANNENTVVDHDTFTGPIAHMEAPRTVADDWANMGIDIMTKANNHTWDAGDEGVWQDFHELSRVGIVHVGVDRNMTEARMARGVTTSKGTAGMVGVYADNIEPGQLFGLPLGREPVFVTEDQLKQLRAMRDSIVARRHEVPVPISVPGPDPKGEVMVFGVTFKVGTPGNAAAPSDIMTRMQESGNRRGKIETKSNGLRLKTFNGVTAAQMAQLRVIAGDHGQGNTLTAFGVNFKVAPGPGEYSYEMDPQVERDILREIRTGKQFYDFQAATVHWHQNRFAFQHYSFDHYPADFEIKFAHDAIDQGADVFFGHGVHTLKGVEIYKGKPIFYGLSNFVVHQQIFRSWRDRGARAATPLTGPILGEGEENENAWAWMEKPDNLEALLAQSFYNNGKLVEVRLYPVDSGDVHRPSSQLGTPKRPSLAVAQRILRDVAAYSQPFGTKISIEGGVGIIRIAQ
ncbi:MAG: hypothetical protein JWR80_5464 [Bradyrhizobium sp.]|nr:hypothetical protein [Bradyrhizobium sp.]